MSETMELSGAKSMYIENNCHKAVRGMREELENWATREQINRQLVAERTSDKSFIIRNCPRLDLFTRARTYDKKKQLLIKMFRSVIRKMDYASKLSVFSFEWVKAGTQTIRQVRMKKIGKNFTNIIVELDDPRLVGDMFLSIDRW